MPKQRIVSSLNIVYGGFSAMYD